jgi:hypothetical protein
MPVEVSEPRRQRRYLRLLKASVTHTSAHMRRSWAGPAWPGCHARLRVRRLHCILQRRISVPRHKATAHPAPPGIAGRSAERRRSDNLLRRPPTTRRHLAQPPIAPGSSADAAHIGTYERPHVAGYAHAWLVSSSRFRVLGRVASHLPRVDSKCSSPGPRSGEVASIPS